MSEVSGRTKLIRRLHEKGMTYDEIGELLGITKQRAHQLATQVRDGFRESINRRIKYVGLRNWLYERRMNVNILEKTCGTRFASSLYGDSEPRKSTIDAILKATGMTYEECFGDEDGGLSE